MATTTTYIIGNNIVYRITATIIVVVIGTRRWRSMWCR
jgi:hypothetical protein